MLYDSVNTPTWNSQTCTKPGEAQQCLFQLQNDRNLVLYFNKNKPRWSSKTAYDPVNAYDLYVRLAFPFTHPNIIPQPRCWWTHPL